MMKKHSNLELLHPDGYARNLAVFGSCCPADLDSGARPNYGEKVDLVILAPCKEEGANSVWLKSAVQDMAECLATDGVGYVMAPRLLRLKIAGLLRKQGLRLDKPVGHIPGWTASSYLAILEPLSASYGFSTIIPLSSWKRLIIKQCFRMPKSAQWLGYLWPSAGLVFRHPKARPLLAWAPAADQADGPVNSAFIQPSWRGQDGTALVYLFHDQNPVAVAKISHTEIGGENQVREADAITHLGQGAREAGVEVPQLLHIEQQDNRSVMYLSLLQGQSATDWLRAHPGQLYSILFRIVRWLERWNQATASIRPLEFDDFYQNLLLPALILEPFLDHSQEYQSWLEQRCLAAVGSIIPFVAAHNDLTMANLIIDKKDGISVVDWETAQAKNWPLVDFVYSVTDAVLTARSYSDRLDAYKACFDPRGLDAPIIFRLKARLASTLNLPNEISELCFHACWLHHALNEHRLSGLDDSRPFLRVLQWLVNRTVHRDEEVNQPYKKRVTWRAI